ncbi:MAG: hypothetical protein NC831_06490 [Candidatus Omnitrophica bacterium]|nr:hypothetical protein [Candidatus Omnitrophota bacterium]
MAPVDVIHNYLDEYRRLEKKTKIKEDIFLFLAILSAFFAIFIVLDIIMPSFYIYADKYRYIVLALIAGTIIKVFHTIYKWARLSPDALALKIERKLPFLNNLLINSVQLGRKTGKHPEAFIKFLINKTVETISPCDIKNLVERKRLKKISILAIILLTLLAAISIMAGRSAKNVFLMSFAPGKFVAGIFVEPGSCSVEKGSPLIVRARVKDSGIPDIEIKNKTTRTEEMIKDGHVFIYTFSEVTSPFSYRIKINGKKSVWYRVNVVDRTMIKKMRIIYQYPQYTGLKTIAVEKNFSEISALSGTKLTVEFHFNNIAGDTMLIFSNGSIIKSPGRSRVKSFKFTLENACFYQIQYFDPATGKTLLSPKEKIIPVFDQIPVCEFVSPGKDVIAKQSAVLPVKLKISDDFGINSVKFKICSKEGEISTSDRVFYQTSGNRKKEMEVNALLQIPASGYSKIAYYAECTDFSPSGNTGRSSIYFIYSPSSASERFSTKKNNPEEEKIQQAQLEQAKKLLEKFAEEQKKVIEAAKKIGKVRNEANLSELQNIAEQEKKWAQIFQKIVNDLNKLAQQTQSKFTLSDEFVEMISHLQAASDAITRGKPLTIPIQEAQMRLELAEELVANIERWLAEAPDSIKWDHQEPSKPILAPEAELPSELEDIIGDLIEQTEDMTEEIEDITSSWMDSLDKGAGWMAMDGSISNMSAKGITGNVLPNQQEVGGRSGEGRTGRSYGEMVEKTAQGKGGRQTPARLTPDNIEPGQVQDTSGEIQPGPTGGGKASGWGPAGLKGPVQDLSFKYAEIAEKQVKLIEKAEKLERELKILNVYNPQIERSIAAMKQFNIQLKEGRYSDLLTTNQMIISNLKQAQQVLTHQAIIRVANSEKVEKKKKELEGIWDEKIPPGYETIVKKYYENISGR